MTIAWLAIIVLLVVVEASTMVLTTIWFAFGALLGMICSMLGAPFRVQFILFLIGSGVAIFFVRPIAVKLLKVGGERTNADRIVGEKGLVTQQINNLEETGLVHICGQSWTARTEDGEVVEKGTPVVALRISGVRLYVQKWNDAEKKGDTA